MHVLLVETNDILLIKSCTQFMQLYVCTTTRYQEMYNNIVAKLVIITAEIIINTE